MSQQPHAPTPEVSALKSDGTKVAPDGVNGCKLDASSTYYFALGGQSAPTESVHFKWDGTITGVITLWETNLDNVALNSSTAGEWIQEDPSTAYIPVSGGGGSVANATITVSAAAGGAFVNMGFFGGRRLRARMVTTAGGNLRVAAHGKS